MTGVRPVSCFSLSSSVSVPKQWNAWIIILHIYLYHIYLHEKKEKKLRECLIIGVVNGKKNKARRRRVFLCEPDIHLRLLKLREQEVKMLEWDVQTSVTKQTNESGHRDFLNLTKILTSRQPIKKKKNNRDSETSSALSEKIETARPLKFDKSFPRLVVSEGLFATF